MIPLYHQEISKKGWKFLKTENRMLVTEIENRKQKIEFLKIENSRKFLARAVRNFENRKQNVGYRK